MGSRSIIIITALLTACVVWRIQGLRWDTDVSSINESHANEMKTISDKNAADLLAANARTKVAQDAAATLDERYTRELSNALTDNEKLRSDVSAGTKRVRIATSSLAACQHSTSDDTSTRSVGNATEVELTAKAGRNILDIRAGIISDQAKLDYLQDYVKDVVKQCGH